jgi:hypothetical protein
MRHAVVNITKTVAATAALACALLFTCTTPASAQADGFGSPVATGPTHEKQYKDNAEYRLFLLVTQTDDTKAQLELLDQWQTRYPDSDFAHDRLEYYIADLAILAQDHPAYRQQVVNKCQEMLKLDPQYFDASLQIAVVGPDLGGDHPSPQLMAEVDSAAHTVIANADTKYKASNKPDDESFEKWNHRKAYALATAHNALAWEALAKNDKPGAIKEYQASLRANPDQGSISGLCANMLLDSNNFSDGLYEIARAAEYAGPGPALTVAQRTQLLDYFQKKYEDYHGSPDGETQIIDMAKTSALPPPGFTIKPAAPKAAAAAAGSAAPGAAPDAGAAAAAPAADAPAADPATPADPTKVPGRKPIPTI